MKKLRYYQREAVDAVHAFFAKATVPNASPLVVLPTGAGKSLVIGALAMELHEQGAKVALVTHRDKLVSQDLAAIREYWPEAPVATYAAKLKRKNVSEITVCQLQSIARKPEVLGAVDVVIIDEAHLVPTEESTQYGRLFAALRQRSPDLRLVGLTATPYRLNQGLLTQGEDRLFHSVVYEAKVSTLVTEGYLSPLVSAAANASIDTSAVATRLGDFALADLELAADVESVTRTVADDVARCFREGRKKALIFGVSIKHAANLRSALLFAGVSCELVHGEHTTEQREAIYHRLQFGDLQAVASCDLLTTGFDVPPIDLVALVRPTKSTSLYVQMLGRGTRLSPGKRDCAVLDYGGNIARHGPIDDVKVKPKVSREGEAPTKVCPQCAGEVHASVRQCVFCGHVFPEPVRKSNEVASSLPPLLSTLPGVQQVRKEPDGKALYRVPVHGQHVDLHQSKTSGKISLRVTYLDERSKKIATEWWTFGQPNVYSEQRAAWWRSVIGGSAPLTAEEAFAQRELIPVPESINLKEDGEWLRVTSRKERTIQEAQPAKAPPRQIQPPTLHSTTQEENLEIESIIDSIWG